ncbi:MAG: hypothetical protein KKF48_05180 [Nanoarchaeota archaeon]|nr:hypothetical protein [Nanoarchaeota archaeon]MBU1028411.1 hypothetical protein [Nanoarchaeota archaeon]
MKATLYRQAKDIERMDEKLRDLNSSNQVDVAELQRNLFQRYESNPVLYDAMQESQSIEESVAELGQVNRGIRKILPWRRNKGHNERLKQLGELVSEPYHLHTSGIFMPDNLITTGAEVTAMAFGVSYLMSRYLLSPNPDVSPEEIQQTMHVFDVVLPTVMSALMAPMFGLLTNMRRFTGLPTEEAKYLDGKVQEFYK